ncbi:UNVERIFIED_CONTAM: hypothetical protein HDU68_008611 [Siphonaria sp. JEL0065]|nr:hypothetical protein HDU68_008611 [Siphonaria sp. JEL0065]
MAMNFGNDWMRSSTKTSTSTPAADDGWSTIKRTTTSQSTSQVFKYSREALLGLFDPSVVAPTDLDASLPIFVADALEPVANLPLTETEKKILALGSVNSEVQTRRNFSTPSNKGGVRGDFVSSRGGSARRNNSDRMFSGRKDASPERRLSMDSDIQDVPQDEEKSAVPTHFPENQSAENVLSSAFVSPSRQLSSNTLGSDPKNSINGLFGGLSIASDLLASSSTSHHQQQDPFLKSSFVAPIGASSSLSDPPGLQFGHRTVAPIVEPIVSNWFYKDPIGNIQGPFTTAQMQDWYTKSFFSEDLPIKREQDLLFEPLSNLLVRFGRDFPFTSVDESESSSGAGGLFLQQQPLPQPQFSAIPAYHRADSFTATGYSPFGGALGGIGGGVHHPLVGGPSRFNSNPSTAALYGNEYIGGRDIRFGAMDHSVQTHGWGSQHESNTGYGMYGQNVPELAFGSLHHNNQLPQHIPQQGYSQVGFSQFGAVAPQFGSQVPSNSLVVDTFVTSPTAKESFVENGNNSNNWQNPADILLTPDASNSVLAAVTATESPQPIPQSPAKSPKKSPRALSPVLRVPTPEPTVATVPSLVVSPVNTLQQLKCPVVAAAPEPVVAEQKQQQQQPKVKSKKSKKSVVGIPSVEVPQAQQQQSSPVIAAAVLEVEEKVTPIAATPAPWAGDKTTPKLSLKEIQELEQREFEQKEREKAKKAHARIMAEAQALAEQTASGIPVGGAPWSAGTGAKKSLAEIMKEEEKERKATEAAAAGNSVTVGGGKRYADHIAPVATNAGSYARPSPAIAPVAPAVSPAVPKATTSGWNVVGKPAATARPAAAGAPVIAAPKTVVASVSASKPVSSSVSTGSPSAPFIQWARQALAPLGRSTTAGIQADDFIQILLSVPTNEPKTMMSICDDTLGGLTAIDPVKFAEEFIRRRRADLQGPAAYAAASGAGSSGGDAARGFDSGFVTVQKKKGKK